jgi:hypothetical protein
MAPYTVLLMGLEVIMQVPLAHPTCCQYKYPAMAPSAVPMAYFPYLTNNSFIRLLIVFERTNLGFANHFSGDICYTKYLMGCITSEIFFEKNLLSYEISIRKALTKISLKIDLYHPVKKLQT